jgi:Uncharacterized conserved protein (DUF2340)
VIKSFPFRVVKNLVLPHVDLTTTTVRDLKNKIKEGAVSAVPLLTAEIQKQSAFKPFRAVEYDTLKIYVKAHGFKVRLLAYIQFN